MNPLFDDYKTIRRRIERKLARPDFVLLHSAIFFLATLMLMNRAINPQMNSLLMLLVWSMALLGHSIATMRRSAVSDSTREAVIQRELQERLKRDDTELIGDARQAFRVQALLDEDLRQRAGVFVSVRALLVLNVALWVMSFWRTGWGYWDGTFAGYWHELARMALVGIIPVVAFNQWRRRWRDQATSTQLTNSTTQDDLYDKRKRLSDEAEIYAFDEDRELVDEVAEHLALGQDEKLKMRF